MYKYDNTGISNGIEVATMGTYFAAPITPFNHGRDRRGVFLALKSQQSGTARWYQDIRHQVGFLIKRRWKGGTIFYLEKFM